MVYTLHSLHMYFTNFHLFSPCHHDSLRSPREASHRCSRHLSSLMSWREWWVIATPVLPFCNFSLIKKPSHLIKNFGAGTHAISCYQIISILIPEHSCNLMQLRRRKPESGKYRLSQIFSTEWKGLDVHLMSTQKQISPTVQVRSWNAELQWSLLTFFSAHANCWFDSCNFLINRMQYSKSSLSTKGWRRGKLCFFTMQVPETH